MPSPLAFTYGLIVRRRSAFTLIELLVVITIIVVLLALLTPALDRAIYQAELALCGANLRGIATGAQTYAIGSRRRYPHRQASEAGELNYLLKNLDFDDRPTLRETIALDLLVDPLVDRIELDAGGEDTVIDSTNPFWFGFKYANQGGMMRIGERWSWTDERSTPVRSYRFDWLVGDMDMLNPENLEALSAHPDDDGVLSLQTGEQDAYEQNDPALNIAANGIANATYSWWRNLGEYRRGFVDLQFIASDGGLRRYDDVDYEDDDRMARVDVRGNKNIYTDPYYLHVPTR